MTKVVVTGGGGFIGSHLVRHLCEQDHKVVVVDNFSAGTFEEFPGRYVASADYKTGRDIDLAKLDLWFDALENCMRGADAVFHLAALPRVQYSLQYPLKTNLTNVSGTVGVLQAAKAAEVRRVVFASSSSVYGDSQNLPLKESQPLDPMSPYALQKMQGEQDCAFFAKHFGLQTVCVRLFNAYGPDADPKGAYALVIAKFFDQLLQGGPMTITGDGEQTRDFTHVRDVVRAFVLAAQSQSVGAGEAINIGGGCQISINRIAELIGGPRTYIPARLEPRRTLADISLAKELLGWVPEVSFEEGIAELKSLHFPHRSAA